MGALAPGAGAQQGDEFRGGDACVVGRGCVEGGLKQKDAEKKVNRFPPPKKKPPNSRIRSSISSAYVDSGKLVRASWPALLIAARSNARAAAISVSWSPRDVVLPPAEI